MNDVQQTILTLLDEVKEICVSNDIQCFLGWKTALFAYYIGEFPEGAHEGCMIISGQDIEKFIRAVADEKKPNRDLEHLGNNPNFPSFYLRYADTSTLSISKVEARGYRCYGIGIEIHVIRALPDSKQQERVQRVIERGFARKAHVSKPRTLKHKVLIGAAAVYTHGFSEKHTKKTFHNWLDLYGQENTERVFIRGRFEKNRYFMRDFFESVQEVDLYGHTFCVPENPELYFKAYYPGINQMKLVQLSKPDMAMINSADLPYQDYLKECGGYERLNKHYVADVRKVRTYNHQIKPYLNEINKAWATAVAAGIQFQLREYYADKLDLLENLLESWDVKGIDEIVKPYREAIAETKNGEKEIFVSEEFHMFYDKYQMLLEGGGKMKVSDYLVERLVDKGVNHFYGYQGTMIAHMVDSISNNEAAYNHSCYNEQGAAFAACGQAKVSGKLAVAYATSGPGAINLLSGVADAYYDSAPVLFITGQINTNEYTDLPELRQQAFQETDVISMAKSITKYCVQITDAQDVRRILEKAVYIANKGRKGPVLIDIPMDIQRAEVDVSALEGYEIPESKEENIDDAVSIILNELQKAERPVLLLGNGIQKEDRELIVNALEILKIPVVTTMLARDVLPYEHPLNFGYIGAAYGHRYANLIMGKKADVIVSFGASLCNRQTGVNRVEFAPEARIIRVDMDEIELKHRIHEDDIEILCDANRVLPTLAQHVKELKLDYSEWESVCKICREKLTKFDDDSENREPNKWISRLSQSVLKGTVVACDVGQHQIWVAQSFCVKAAQRIVFSGGHGAMGFALPAAIGAHYHTGESVVAICGDGAFQMNIQELQWVVREQLPIVIVILNNQSLGLIRQQQDSLFAGMHYGAAETGGYSTPNFTAIGKAYGISSHRAESLEKLQKVYAKRPANKPCLIEVVMAPTTAALPKTNFGEPIYRQSPYVTNELYDYLLNL